MSNETWVWHFGSVKGIGTCFFQVQKSDKYDDDPEREIRIRQVSAYQVKPTPQGPAVTLGHWPQMDLFIPGNTLAVARYAIDWVSPVTPEVAGQLDSCWSKVVRPPMGLVT